MKDLACKDFLKLVNGLIGHVIYSRGKLSDRHVMFRGADLDRFYARRGGGVTSGLLREADKRMMDSLSAYPLPIRWSLSRARQQPSAVMLITFLLPLNGCAFFNGFGSDSFRCIYESLNNFLM